MNVKARIVVCDDDPDIRDLLVDLLAKDGYEVERAEDGIVLVDPDICIGCKLCSWACPYGAREYDYTVGVMKKCTLCVDRIYNTNLEPEDQVPACVRACPTGARHFGDLGDETSAVSQLVKERGGFDLFPEMGYKPTNKYLPPRARRETYEAGVEPLAKADGSVMEKLFVWADKLLSASKASAPANPQDNSDKLEG